MCKCKKSKCIKLYCECFQNGNTCLPSCKCVNCENTSPDKTHELLQKLLKRKRSITSGCNCSKSQCSKKYCECYKNGKECSELCKCTNCTNDEIYQLDQFLFNENDSNIFTSTEPSRKKTKRVQYEPNQLYQTSITFTNLNSPLSLSSNETNISLSNFKISIQTNSNIEKIKFE